MALSTGQSREELGLVVYSQYYRTKTSDRQIEIDECLRNNLNHPLISKVVLFRESDAPPLPSGTVPVEVIDNNKRITYAEWFRYVRRQRSGIALLLNADIYLDTGIDVLAKTFDSANVFLALTRYNPGHAGFHLNDYPHWTQDVWGVRADAELPESLLYASSFPLGFPGCDNRIAYVMWSHGFQVRNPCYHVRSVHLQASTARGYDKTSDRLYGGVSYVHPSLNPSDDAELEFTIWTRSHQQPAGMLINQQAVGKGLHQLKHTAEDMAERFNHLQRFTGLSWQHEAIGSAHIITTSDVNTSEDTIFLPLHELQHALHLDLQKPRQIVGISLRLSLTAQERVEIAISPGFSCEETPDGKWVVIADVPAGGQRVFLDKLPWHNKHVRTISLSISRTKEGAVLDLHSSAELVLFCSSGSLEEAKSIRVIAEPDAEEKPKEVDDDTSFAEADELLLFRIAASPSLTLEGTDVQLDEQSKGEESAPGDKLTASMEGTELKHAFVVHKITGSGYYIAKAVMKSGSESKVVLRINDQTGVNDARQAFNLVSGAKIGLTQMGGTVTHGHASISKLGDDWYDCRVGGMFVDEFSELHAPSIWLEHYAPSSSTGFIYCSKGGLCSLETPPSELLSDSSLTILDSTDTSYDLPEWVKSYARSPLDKRARPFAYESRRRSEVADLGIQATTLHQFSNRFFIYELDEKLYFDDKRWPWIGVTDKAQAPCSTKDGIGMFIWGFCQPVLDLGPTYVGDRRRHPNDVNFWQYPALTERNAFEQHFAMEAPVVNDGTIDIYIGLPWATWIDLKHQPRVLLASINRRVRAVREVLAGFGYSLRVHTVCQHILWQEASYSFKEALIDVLWLAHTPTEKHQDLGIKIFPWHLFAVNVKDTSRWSGLQIIELPKRRYLASFIGAHMDHYQSDVRLKLPNIATASDVVIKLTNEWHFNSIVYGEQIFDPYILETRSAKLTANSESVVLYNKTLSESIFSLCPAGAGQNSLRLWESLAIGVIPIILADNLVLPMVNRRSLDSSLVWSEAVILWPESQVNDLENYLRSVSGAEIESRVSRCRDIYQYINSRTCFAALGPEVQLQPYPCRLLGTKEDIVEILSDFRPQQLSGDLCGVYESQAATNRQRIEFVLDAEQRIVIVIIHFDKPEYVRSFNLKAKSIKADNVIVENAISYNKYREVGRRQYLQQDKIEDGHQGNISWEFSVGGFWTEAIRLTITASDASIHTHLAASANIHSLEISVSSNLFARSMQMFDAAGLIRQASDLATERHDDLYLTANIESAAVVTGMLKQFQSGIADAYKARQLFALDQYPTTNELNETISHGISMYVHLMNRNVNVIRNISNWLKLSFDELILLDWSSAEHVNDIDQIYSDNRVRVVRVEGQTRFTRTLAQNLATRISRYNQVFKSDSDVEYREDFFTEHLLQPNQFWVGEWKQARNHNERHLHGETFYWRNDFLRVGGYDERIKSYGHDDTNLKDRMLLAGLEKRVFNYDYMHHQEHDQSVRAQGSHGLHPMVATYANRLMAAYEPLWSPVLRGASYELIHQRDDSRYFVFRLVNQIDDYTTVKHIEEAIRIVGSWYLKPHELDTLTAEQINGVIWEKQVE